MYSPEHFKETNPERISALIKGNPLGMLITAPEGEPFVSHLPFTFESSAGFAGQATWPHGACKSAVAAFCRGQQGAGCISRAHAYVSPSWYSSPGVPTWNYAVVHLRGIPRLIEGESELEALVEQITHVHESHMPNPWKPNLTGERRSKLLNMIVGFEIDLTDIQAKFKLSQNRPLEDQRCVVDKLSQSSNQTEAAVAKLMSGAS